MFKAHLHMSTSRKLRVASMHRPSAAAAILLSISTTVTAGNWPTSEPPLLPAWSWRALCAQQGKRFAAHAGRQVPIAAPHEVKAPETGPAEPPRLPQFPDNRIITLFGKIAK